MTAQLISSSCLSELAPARLPGAERLAMRPGAPEARLAPTVFVIEPDPYARERLVRLARRQSWHCICLADGSELPARAASPEPACIVLNFTLPDGSGLDLQKRLSRERGAMPVVFQTACVPLAHAVEAMKAGAVDILHWPYADAAMIDAIETGFERSRAELNQASRQGKVMERHASLTRREKEVMSLVASGLMNKQIAYALDLSEITVKAHRGRMMRKMEAASLPDLVIMAGMLGQDRSSALQ